MVPVRETSKPCAPFLSRIRFTWYRNTTAESRGAVSFRRGTFLSPLRTTSRTGPSSNERVHATSCFFLSLPSSLRWLLEHVRDSRGSAAPVVAPTRSLASEIEIDTIFPFRSTDFYGFSFLFFGIFHVLSFREFY